MRTRRDRSMLAGAIAAWYCAAALTQGTATPASQPNPNPASTPTPASQPNPNPASTPAPVSQPSPAPASAPNPPTPASEARPTSVSPPPTQQRNDQTRFPASAQEHDRVIDTPSQSQASRCAALTGLPRAECERRDSPDTENLPAGVTRGQMDRQAQRAAEAARDTRARSSAADTLRAPPASAPATSTTAPAPTAPAPESTPHENADTLNRPRE